MIYVLEHDYSRGMRLAATKRVADVKTYGPFETQGEARVWASHWLLDDSTHKWRLVDLAPNLI